MGSLAGAPLLQFSRSVLFSCLGSAGGCKGVLQATSTLSGHLSGRQSQQYQQQQAQQQYSTIPDPDPAETQLYAEQLQQPNFVHPVTITQLDNLCRQPTLQRLVKSATFLKSQLPARLQNHVHRLQALPQPANPQLQELLASTVRSKQRGLEVASDWKQQGTDDLAGLRHFESHLATFREHLEVEVGKLTVNAQALTEGRGWWDNAQQVRWLNRMLDLCHWYLLSTRVMLTQHSAALAALQASSSSSSSNPNRNAVLHYHEPGHKSTNPKQVYTPPHQQLAGSAATAVSLVRRQARVLALTKLVAEDCRAFCVEKNSAAPDVQFLGGEGLTATLVVPYVEFLLTEVLKNAMQAVVSRYGAWEVDDAQPVLVKMQEIPGDSTTGSSSSSGGSSSSGSQIEIVVTDKGNGIPADQAAHMYDYFWSNNRATNTLWVMLQQHYGYSRNHGSPFQGIGVGVPMSRVYAHFMGGSIEWETDSWRRHTSVTTRLPKHGFTF
ncbi:hypothetical protein OEZ85_012817 [Tetradesmus obliquus]|uniref:Protein-serine/threonine kinase n=1 Tax=Tetradesmus obliquus TaxID=3088 RepID=A0ABY8U400_TETOB|nr:hypothetical protein OEZ85_012817 [Tetradesmus obliquus]